MRILFYCPYFKRIVDDFEFEREYFKIYITIKIYLIIYEGTHVEVVMYFKIRNSSVIKTCVISFSLPLNRHFKYL